MIGEEFGSYKIVRKLGEGGMGEVYLARHIFMDRPAAIKVLLPELSTNKDIVGRFFAEARATELIKHPNIVQILDCAIHPTSGRGYLVMEFLDGESLGARLERSTTLDVEDIAAIAHDTASALQAAHEVGIVHRDLKPDNVFLTKPPAGDRSDGRPFVKVLDFGIAKLAYPGSVSKTATGSILGTPLYMSPEQGRGLAKVDLRSDIYSLGCIIFEMACGRPPFVREAPGDLIIAHATEAPPRISSLVDGIPRDLEQLVDRLLAKAPEARPQSMAEVAAALRPIQRRSSVRDGGAAGSASGPPESAFSARAGGTLRLPPEGFVSAPSRAGGTVPLPLSDEEFGRDIRPRRSPASGPRSVPNTTLSSTASQSLSPVSRRGPSRSSASIFLGVLLAAGLGVGGTVLWSSRTHTPRPEPTAVSGAPAAGATAVELPVARVEASAAPSRPAQPTTVAPPAGHGAVANAARPEPAAEVSPRGHADEPTREPRKHHSRDRRDQSPATAASTASVPVPAPAGDSTSFEPARAAFARADYITALRLAKRAVREGTGVPAYILVGQSYEHLERPEEAADSYRAALALDPSDKTAGKLLRQIEKKK